MAGMPLREPGSPLYGDGSCLSHRQGQGAAKQALTNRMEFKRLGSTDAMVPEIGLGTWRYRGGAEPLRRGIELGATLIDTAEMYSTEAVVGEAIKGIRDQVFVASKVSGGHLRYEDVLRAADGSLGKLVLDQIYL